METLSLSPQQEAAREHAFSMPIEDINPADVELFVNDTIGHYFERLRRDDPVHLAHSPVYGPYWSITKYKDIMAVDTNHKVFSSDWQVGGITLFDEPVQENKLQMFIAMDPPKHDVQRKAVTAIVSPSNLLNMEQIIRERTIKVLDNLPRDEPFDWVDKVSVELTSLMLATLFDFPVEDYRLLTHWSNVIVSSKLVDPNAPTPEERMAEMRVMLGRFTELWNQRVNAPPTYDLVSMLAHNPETRNMGPMEFMGNLALLIVGGNDTTRNSMTGGMLAMSRHPEEWAKFRANPTLIPNMVSEIIRWQTPLSHMRRTATQDFEIGGKTIKKGDKVAMWYLSGNRDEEHIANADDFIIDRPNARQHIAFGFGVHRCVGNRLAELQLRILWEEIHKRFERIEVLDPTPPRARSTFVHGILSMQVRIPS